MIIRTLASLAAGLFAIAPAQAKPAKLWELAGLETPESVILDSANKVLYVSNVAGAPTDKDGNGFISKVTLDGKIETLKWVTGLDGPKGLALAGSKLYAADVGGLVEIDTKDGKVLNTYPIADAKFVNDAAADAQGRIYVSDTGANKIWRLANGRFEVWLESPELNSPNGLLVQGDNLIVAAWGTMPEKDKPGVPAGLLKVSLTDKKVQPLGDGTKVGNLDGLEAFGTTSYLVTDWVAGALYEIEASGKATQLLDFNQGSADLFYDATTKIAYVPLMMENKLEAYTIE